ncbi:DUF3035 domain-containing protein [Pyruvatibacter mobilis]|uniref:DUF3035 domain-containing protein n=1 Tax=Pyruvatibacter mobilis TaxID=1712261 RepID=UPI003BB0A353
MTGQAMTQTVFTISRLKAFAGLAAGALLLAGCGGGGLDDALGLGKNPPDEFAIVTKAPLAIPPDYALRPPQPGASPRQSRSAQELAASALYGESGDVSSRALGQPGGSSGEAALLANAGATNASPEVRKLIESEYQSLIDADKTFADRIIFWQDRGPQPYPVDAQAEAQRLRKNDALGEPVTEGETPRIEPKENQGLLEGLF